MRLLPHLECEIRSDRSAEEIHRILESVTDSRKITFSTDAEFAGEIEPFAFQIVPTLRYQYYRNSFLPVIRGNVKEWENGTIVDIKMSMNLLVCVFLSVWFGMLFLFSLIGILVIITGGVEESTIFLFSFGMIMLGQLLVRRAFGGPAKKAARRLEELLG